MAQFLQRALLCIVAALAAGGCSNVGMFGGNGGGAIHVAESKKTNPDAPLPKYAASIRINRYTDARKTDSPRKIGTGAENVSGMSGKDIVLDQDVATMVTGAMKARLDTAGFKMSEAQDAYAQFELSGVVKELTYDVKARDEVSIAIETTLKETGTSKVLWSGIVAEKNDRFAGVSGNNKNDVAMYLLKELGMVTAKTSEAISASLMVARPELFNLTPGTRAIPGVTVLVAPTDAGTPAPTLPAPQESAVPDVKASAASGLLLVNTRPAHAKVYLDEVYYGLSPLRLEMEPGVHAIVVKMEGYRTVSEKVSVRKGDSTEMELNLER